MKDRTAIVTGGSRGIGRAICVEFAKRGANLLINYAGNSSAAEETAELCRNFGVQADLVQGDVAEWAACERIAQTAIKTFGSVDILVNNAGITRDNLLMRMSEEDFDAVIRTNLRGSFLMMKAVSRQMMKQRYGRIVNLSSVVGLLGNAGQVNYAASKGGVVSMTKSFAKEVASRNITVNAIAPGFIETDMTAVLKEDIVKQMIAQIPMKKLGQAEDVAETAVFLAKSKYITGQVIHVNGGMAMY